MNIPPFYLGGLILIAAGAVGGIIDSTIKIILDTKMTGRSRGYKMFDSPQALTPLIGTATVLAYFLYCRFVLGATDQTLTSLTWDEVKLPSIGFAILDVIVDVLAYYLRLVKSYRA